MNIVGSFGNADVVKINSPTLEIKKAQQYDTEKALVTLWETAKEFVNAKHESYLSEHLQSLQAKGAADAMNTFSKEQEIQQKFQKNIESGMSEEAATFERDRELAQQRSAPIKANQSTFGGFLHANNVYVDSYKKTMAHNLATKTTEKVLLNEDAKNYTPEQFNGYVYDLMQQDSQGMQDDVKSVYTLSMTREFPNLMQQYQKVRLGHLIDQDRASKGEAIYNSYKSGNLGDQQDVGTYLLSPDNVNSSVYFQASIKHALLNKDPVVAQRLSEAVFNDTRYTPEQRMVMQEAYDSAFAWVGKHTNWYDVAEADKYATLTKIAASPDILTKEQVVAEVMKQNKAADAAGMGAYKISLLEAYKAHDKGETARQKSALLNSSVNVSEHLLDTLFRGGFDDLTLDLYHSKTGMSKDDLRTGMNIAAKQKFSNAQLQASTAFLNGDKDTAEKVIYENVTLPLSRILQDSSVPTAIKSDMLQQAHNAFKLSRFGITKGVSTPLGDGDLDAAYSLTQGFARGYDDYKMFAVNEAFASAMDKSLMVTSYLDGKTNLKQAQDLASKGVRYNPKVEGAELSQLLKDTVDEVKRAESSEYWTDIFSTDLDEDQAKFARGWLVDVAQTLVRRTNLDPKQAVQQAMKVLKNKTQGMDTKTGLLIRAFTPVTQTRDENIFKAKANVVSRWVKNQKEKTEDFKRGYSGDAAKLFNSVMTMTRKDFDNTVYQLAKAHVQERYLKGGSTRLASEFKSWDFVPDSYSVVEEADKSGRNIMKYTMTFRDINGDGDSFTFTNEDVIDYWLKTHMFDPSFMVDSFEDK